jgi:hypothetical protein
MIDDLKGVLSKVSVFKSVLQYANTHVINWISTSHKNLDLTWLTAWVAQKCISLKAGTCRITLNIDKNMFLDQDVLKVGFQWCLIYDGHTKSGREKAGVEPLYAVHIVAEKKDRTLVPSLMTALLESPVSSIRPHLLRSFLVTTDQLSKQSLEKHKYVQECLLLVVLPDLESLNLRARMSVKQKAISMDDSATVVEGKKNPMAQQLLMKIPKKDMPGISLFVDIGSNWQKSEFLAMYPKTWKDEACFVAANAPAYLYHDFGDVGLSFFLPYVCNAVKTQGWNEKEDCPVTAGEEALDRVVKPYAKDLRMNMMFDFSNMEASMVQDDIQQQSLSREEWHS